MPTMTESPGANARLERMMEQYGNDLLRICCVYLKDASMAEDAVQETFVKAYKGYHPFRADADEKTWLMRIAINTCKDIRRSAYFRHVDAVLDEAEKCGLFLGLLLALLGALVMFIGFWKTLILALLFCLGYFWGAVENKSKFFKDTVNRVVPEKKEENIDFRAELAKEQEARFAAAAGENGKEEDGE